VEKFYLEQYFAEELTPGIGEAGFNGLCVKIEDEFQKEWEKEGNYAEKILDIQKRAIIGYENEVAYFKDRIAVLIRKHGAENTTFPPWHASLTEAVYHEIWGLAGMAEWFGAAHADSSSAKIIGERVYFLEDGVMRLKPQRVCDGRREQMIRAFLLLAPEERADKEFHEVYLLDGTRITVFRGGMTKQSQDVIVFRRYVVPSYTFEEQAARGTIPPGATELFKDMVKLGYNVAFCGPVRSAKTTFLSTWQSYEDRTLEGVMVETDPEIPLHRLMPEAPVVQLLADGEKLKNISKNLLRSDADYFVMAEARDGIALDTAVRMARKGTRRMKITFHTRNPQAFPEDAAVEIVRAMGGGVGEAANRVADSFDYVFYFIQLKKKNRKRLKSVHEMRLDHESGRIVMREICVYRHETDDWRWVYHVGEDKRQMGKDEDAAAFADFDARLKELAGAG
jgi:pilus assembly protein CpaF